MGGQAQLAGSEPMPYGWPSALHRAGLVDIVTSSTLFEEPMPLANRNVGTLYVGVRAG